MNQIIEALLCNLCVRKNCPTYSSNFSQYLYFLSKDIETSTSLTEEITITQNNNLINFQLPNEFKMKDLLEKINSFFENEVKDYRIISEDQLKNINFLQTLPQNKNIEDLIYGLQISEKLSKSLDNKFDISKITDDSDPLNIKIDFPDPISLSDEEDIKDFNIIGNLPVFIAFFAMRVNVSIDKVCYFSLDESELYKNINNLLSFKRSFQYKEVEPSKEEKDIGIVFCSKLESIE